MAGIYVHIPLCSSRCHYCDFYSSTNLNVRDELVDSLCSEIKQRKNYLDGQTIKTIYVGGGTPSMLNPEHLEKIFNTILTEHDCELEEVTVECNPDDLTQSFIDGLKKTPANRVSMGIQSFDDRELKLINRRHTAAEAVDAVKRLQDNGISNISIDLIYGLPNQSMDRWTDNIMKALQLNVPHISAYSLTYEEGTVLHNWLKQGKIAAVDDNTSLEMFKTLRHELQNAGYEHYEISNYAKSGMRAKHNSSYWNGTPYLGIGPSAHSFDGTSRQWNIADSKLYMKGIAENNPQTEHEVLTETEMFEEFVMTRMRTADGIALDELKNKFRNLASRCLKSSQKHIECGNLIEADGHLRLSEKGIFVSDGIIVDMIDC